MKRVGLFGGSFNPIHVGHVALAQRLREAAGLDEVWLMVTPRNPFKQGQWLLADDERLRLARRAVEGVEGVVASDYEFSLPQPNYTYNTLARLTAERTDCSFTLVIGADNWVSFPRWHRSGELLQRWPVVVYPREGMPVDEGAMPPGVRLISLPLLPVSSTQVRQAVAQGLPIDSLVPAQIAADVVRLYSQPEALRAAAEASDNNKTK